MRSGKPMIVGHRGEGGLSPENTAAAFTRARSSGANLIETDVQLSADGEMFLFHDHTGARTTNVAQVFPDRATDHITSFTLEELRRLDAGSYFGEQFAGERIPALLDAARAMEPVTGLNIEIKSPQHSPGIERALAAMLANEPALQRLIPEGRLVVSSFNAPALRTFHRLAPHVPLRLVGAVPADDVELAEVAGWAEGLVTNYRTLRQADIDRVHACGLTLSVYTVNSVQAMAEMTERGVDSIITDFPGVLAAVQTGAAPIPDASGVEVLAVVPKPENVDGAAGQQAHVVLTNTSEHSIDVGGYLLQLQDTLINRLAVGAGYCLAPGGELRVYPGTGTSTADRHYNGCPEDMLDVADHSIAVLTPDLTLLDLYAY